MFVTLSKAGSPGFSVSGACPLIPALIWPDDAWRRPVDQPVLFQYGQGIGVGGIVGRGRPGSDGRRVVADHVGDDQAEHFGAVSPPEDLPAACLRDVLPYTVDLRDGRPALQQQIGQPDNVFQRYAGGRTGHQCRASARYEENDQVAFAGGRKHVMNGAHAFDAILVRQRVTGLEDFDHLCPGFRPVAVDDHAVGDAAIQQTLHFLRPWRPPLCRRRRRKCACNSTGRRFVRSLTACRLRLSPYSGSRSPAGRHRSRPQ